MLVGLLLILIGIVFAYFGIGGRGSVRSSSGGFVITAGAGVLLIVVGALVLALPG